MFHVKRRDGDDVSRETKRLAVFRHTQPSSFETRSGVSKDGGLVEPDVTRFGTALRAFSP